ncbi:ATP-grasp domain-containing protein [Bacillus sp. B1-b2]|uniref:ATP-grasp domain-containing protein n=1 Tax=Bacillus sp. B1-b2 TaxID=2653201 RepID=UPI001262A922|nr:ATP-grasp domain-containing protein [Bacillus sp. B1-b2]KAB7664867.1 carbamoyl-phosphate synthase large subunit [Bacillus sp. B1-b2]
MKKRIWFNQWFSTVAHFIDMIKYNSDGMEFEVYGTSTNKDAVYLSYCDVAFMEPSIKGMEYVHYCLDFCRTHNIDIFVPRKENVLISRHLKKFTDIGVEVLVCPDANLMDMLDDKEGTYELMKNHPDLKNVVHIPEYRIVRTAEEFKEAYYQLKDKGHTVCFKPVIGEGGQGFRVIQEQLTSIHDLFYEGVSHNITLEHAYQILIQQKEFPPLMVLEYLDGVEYSIDCLAYDGELMAAIPRKKGQGRVRELEENKELIHLAKEINKALHIPYIYNIQVRYKEGIPKLLEINPRMSGGLHYSCLAGINFPYKAIKLLLMKNKAIEFVKPQFGIRSSYLEKEVILKDWKQESKVRL